MRRGFARIGLVLTAGLLLPVLAAGAGYGATTGPLTRYIVVFEGTARADGGTALAGSWGTNHAAALAAVDAAGGRVTADLSRQIAVMMVESTNPAFATAMASSPLVMGVARDEVIAAVPTAADASTSQTAAADASSGGGPDESNDPLESQQWSMQMIRAPQAHGIEAGWMKVDVGILDTGIDSTHIDFDLDGVPGGATNVDCERGRDSVGFGPGVGTSEDPCIDNGFHGTHVAGIVAAQANGRGIVGVAPNVTLVPVKVCDTEGYCYAQAVVDAITYAGRIRLDVINMSFFTDDERLGESTEFKCEDDPEQGSIREAVERAVAYARGRGVVPVAAAGNSDTDLANKPAPYDGDCKTVPAEAPGVIAVAALGPSSEKASYSSYGFGSIDVSAPGGNGTTGNCRVTVLSTIPGNTYGCFKGTSMASPHAAGVAALIVSRFGSLSGGDVVMSPSKVESLLEATAVDIGLRGYDECFGAGRVDAFRAVRGTTTGSFDRTAPDCPEYKE